MVQNTAVKRRYHYVITGQCPVPNAAGGWWTGWQSGTLDVSPGVTRSELFAQVYAGLVARAREQGSCRPSSTVSVLFWSLEPDLLPADEATGGPR